jgi:hypothetical protein
MRASAFIEPCLPSPTDRLPSDPSWVHEIKHDGFRIIARKDRERVRLDSRPGNDFTSSFPRIVEAMATLRYRSCIIDGEAVVCDDHGVASFDRIRYRRDDDDVFLFAFDLIELSGDDLRREPLDVRKATLWSMLTKVSSGIRFNEHIEGEGPTVFAHACKMGLEGIVSKRKDSPYRSGRSPAWLKMKNPNAPAVKREAEEDWGKEKWPMNLRLKRAPIGWNQNDYDVVEDGVIVGRIFFLDAVGPKDSPWMWTMADGEDRTPTLGYEATCEAAMAAFAKSWRWQ